MTSHDRTSTEGFADLFKREVNFFVSGHPQPGGSKRAFYIPKLKRAIITDDNPKAKDWKATVITQAKPHFTEPWTGPIYVEATFLVLRPKSHYGTGKNAHVLKRTAPEYPTTKPDATKLFRSTEDALTAVAWRDDSQVVDQHVRKRYGVVSGVELRIFEIREELV